MLHAVNSRKARLSAFRAAGQRVPTEDVVTSTVFGPLAFFDPLEANLAVKALLASLQMEQPNWTGIANLTLWPRHVNVPGELRSSYVEPDLVISDAEGAALIIEVKWGAPLSAFELASQWLSLTPEQRRKSVHLLLVLEPGPYQDDVAADVRQVSIRDYGGWRLSTKSWREAADAFRAMGSDTCLGPGTRRWADSVHAFLRREDPAALVGWPSLGLETVQDLDWKVQASFFHDLLQIDQSSWRFNS
jgi:hypothetical protein